MPRLGRSDSSVWANRAIIHQSAASDDLSSVSNGNVRVMKEGSEQESGRMRILRGFLKTRIFRLQHRPPTTFARNGQNWWVRCGNDAPWDLRRNLYAELSLVPRSLETRTKHGFPLSHSDRGDGTRFGGKANPAKIAGPVGFLHRT